jgi:hypothetical protein
MATGASQRVARRAQSRSAADERVGASLSLCVPRGASAAPARRRAAAVEAYTLPATAVRLCYSGHAAAMGRNIAQRVRADRRCRYSSASFFALHSLLRCAPLLRLTCVPLPLPRWLACLVQRSAQHARCARSYAVASCRPASAARTALHSVRPPRRNPPLSAHNVPREPALTVRSWCVITCHAPSSMSACACYPRLRSCSAPSSAVLCPAGQLGFPPTLLQAASARHLRGQRHPG